MKTMSVEEKDKRDEIGHKRNLIRIHCGDLPNCKQLHNNKNHPLPS